MVYNCATIELHCEVVAYYISDRRRTMIRYTFWAKMASFREAYLGKRFVCCALTIEYSIYIMVGRSMASIYDLGGIFTSALAPQ